ncbi:MAG: helix-turn-helix domain-containing protein, partial [Candidatus Sericytochromatia bacterium]
MLRGKNYLGSHVRAKRLELGLEYREAGQRMGVTGSTIGSWESGRHPPEFIHYRAIFAFLGYVPDFMIAEDA